MQENSTYSVGMVFGGPKADFVSCMMMHRDLREDGPLIIKSTGMARGARLWLEG